MLSTHQHDRYLDLTARAQYFQRAILAMPANPEVDARGPQSHIAEHHFIEERRQPRIAQADFATLRIAFETQRCFEQGKWRGARPCLRRAGNGVQGRSTPFFTLKAAEQFGKPP